MADLFLGFHAIFAASGTFILRFWNYPGAKNDRKVHDKNIKP